ncbi:unnamed protein product [Allacma fusca]|uniref:Uncharacterized protein n=1 Tax=Allacma fusca TaxID=39272 RepID=A0A8J2L250_9HEXA|nr:unnamed protein product [Allacma fusca]
MQEGQENYRKTSQAFFSCSVFPTVKKKRVSHLIISSEDFITFELSEYPRQPGPWCQGFDGTQDKTNFKSNRGRDHKEELHDYERVVTLWLYSSSLPFSNRMTAGIFFQHCFKGLCKQMQNYEEKKGKPKRITIPGENPILKSCFKLSLKNYANQQSHV